jgi:uncharacterized protein (DUF427 family)
MPTASWEGAVIAQSDRCEMVEGNAYFPPDAVRREHLAPSDHTSVCSWKGTARYYDVVVGDRRNPNAAWTYPTPSPAARKITGYVAFWKGVRVDP